MSKKVLHKNAKSMLVHNTDVISVPADDVLKYHLLRWTQTPLEIDATVIQVHHLLASISAALFKSFNVLQLSNIISY